MTSLLAISIGPVQEFIAAARKTADLYAGSHLLVSVVKEVAKALNRDGAEFIFPADLESDGANKILVRVQGDPANVAALAARAKATAQDFLWAEFRTATRDLEDFIGTARARVQMEHFLEFYAAWVPETGDYARDRKKVENLLAGRKALRDFESFSQSDEGVPKSLLDPAFASVFIGSQVPKLLIDQTRFKPSEVLDAISLLKREWGGTQTGNVPSTHELAHWAKFPHQDPPPDPDQPGETRPAYAYYVILVADGDNMGAKLEQLEREGGANAHQIFSRALDSFAKEARKTVVDHDGFPIYTGGDDVLALLPVHQALACANALQEAFRNHAGGCTLSAGVAIVHYREPLSTSLAQARAAEKTAKNVAGKNALCVALHTRGGSPVRVEGKWPLATEMKFWQTRPLPRGLTYELHELAREWPEGFQPEVMSAEARRIADRKADAEGHKLTDEDLRRMAFSTVEELKAFAQMLIVARFLSGKGDCA